MASKQLPRLVGPNISNEDFCTNGERKWLTKKLNMKTRSEEDWAKIQELLAKSLFYSATPIRHGMEEYNIDGLLYLKKDRAIHVATCKEYLLETLKENHISEKDCSIFVTDFDIAYSVAHYGKCNLMIDSGNKRTLGFLEVSTREERIFFDLRVSALTDS